MIKVIKKSAMFSAFVLGFMLIVNKVTLATAKCYLNGKEVPCAELGKYFKAFLGLGIGFVVLILAITIWAFVFWVMMIVHATQHAGKDKLMWIILMLFTHILGALIYYFVVKRKTTSAR